MGSDVKSDLMFPWAVCSPRRDLALQAAQLWHQINLLRAQPSQDLEIAVIKAQLPSWGINFSTSPEWISLVLLYACCLSPHRAWLSLPPPCRPGGCSEFHEVCMPKADQPLLEPLLPGQLVQPPPLWGHPWPHSRLLMSFLHCGAPDWMQHLNVV